MERTEQPFSASPENSEVHQVVRLYRERGIDANGHYDAGDAARVGGESGAVGEGLFRECEHWKRGVPRVVAD